MQVNITYQFLPKWHVLIWTYWYKNREFKQGPDLQRILRQTYDSAALTPDLRRACELRAINKKS